MGSAAGAGCVRVRAADQYETNMKREFVIMLQRHSIPIIVSALAIALWVAPAGATVTDIYVDITATGGSDDGTSWTDAFHSDSGIQKALDAAAAIISLPDDTVRILVAEGEYRPSKRTERTVARTETFKMMSGADLYGGFPEGGDSFASRDPATNVTILTGDLDGDDWLLTNMDDNAYHVVTVDETADGVTIEGFKITRGNADRLNGIGNPPPNYIVDRQGSGLTNRDRDDADVIANNLVVRDCVFTINLSDDHGAFNDHGERTFVEDCTFDTNKSDVKAGGYYNHNGGNSTLEGCVFEHNVADQGGGAYVGEGATTIFDGCTFESNDAFEFGAGLYIHNDAEPDVTDCVFELNDATQRGAGIYVNQAAPTIDRCIFLDNEVVGGGGGSDFGGAGVYVTGQPTGGGTATIKNSIFSDNASTNASGGGGAIYLLNVGATPADALIENCVFTGDSSAEYGGGFFSKASDAELKTCKFIDEYAAQAGGAMNTTDGGSQSVADSLFIGNTASGTFKLGSAWVSDSTTVTGEAGFVRSKFVGNTGLSVIWSQSNDVYVDNCLIARNPGAALVQSGSTYDESMYVRNSTVAHNAHGAQIGSGSPGDLYAKFYDSIFWGNGPSGGSSETDQIDNATVVTHTTVKDCSTGSGGYCESGSGSHSDNTSTDPDFVKEYGDEYTGTWDDDDTGSDDAADYVGAGEVTTSTIANAAKTTYTFVTWPGSFPAVADLPGLIFQPNADAATEDDYTIIFSANSTSKELVVWGDYSAHLVDGKTFKVLDYHLDTSTPSAAIDAGSNSEAAGACGTIDYCDAAGYGTCTSDVCLTSDKDLDGNTRIVTCDSADVDMGAYEVQSGDCP